MTGFQIVIDALTPATLAAFWAQALQGYAVRPYDAAEIERLAAMGLTPAMDPSVPIDGSGPTIWFQKSGGPARQRNRIHFDLSFGDRSMEVARLTALGARIHEVRADHTVMHDPEGNQFCVFDPKR